MLIIVEGPDCARKSTLATLLDRQIRKRTRSDQVTILHAGPPTRHPLDEYVTPLLNYRAGEEHHVVCDRWHLGELVYPAIFGRSSQCDDAVFRYVELFLQSRGAYLVVVTPDVDELRDCLTRRGDDPGELERVEAVRDGFIGVATRTALPMTWLKDETLTSDVVWSIVDDASAAALRASALDSFVTYVGPRWPRRLLVGDVRKTGTEPDDLRPAFMPYPATSGHYLMRALEHVDADAVGVVNGCDVDDVAQLWYTLNRPQIVTLGRNAQRATRASLDRQGRIDAVPTTAPHPQWQRRFAYHNLDNYRVQMGVPRGAGAGQPT
jgi:thymidylate kinase